MSTDNDGLMIKNSGLGLDRTVSPASFTLNVIGAQKQLTQAVFDGLPPEYRWAAVNSLGQCYAGNAKLLQAGRTFHNFAFYAGLMVVKIGSGFDATDWKNSKIERLSDTCIDDMGIANFQKKCQRKEATVRVNRKHSHYFKDVSGVDQIDVYAVLRLFEVTDPCLQHIVKKALCAGRRGAKDWAKDVQEIADTANRLIELEGGN
jgi:DNA-binding protein Fis